jgi:hypothetical protein
MDTFPVRVHIQAKNEHMDINPQTMSISLFVAEMNDLLLRFDLLTIPELTPARYLLC